MAQKRIVVTTFGSLGDLHPYLALALGLRARGHDAIVATGECYRHKIEALGLDFAVVRPDSAWVTDPEKMRWFSHRRWGLIRVAKMQLRWLREAYGDTLVAAAGADLLVGNLASYSARLVAEKTGVPWVSAMHIPVLFYSAYDPPLLTGLPIPSKSLRFLGPRFWGAAWSVPQMEHGLVGGALASLPETDRPPARHGAQPADGWALASASSCPFLEIADGQTTRLALPNPGHQVPVV